MRNASSDKMEEKKYLCRRALLLLALVLVLCLLACLTICIRLRKPANRLTAYIYQDGQLIETIDLYDVAAPYTFTIPAPAGGSNTVEVRPDSIGIINADCPDKLCVSTGFVDSSLLPIVCLPHQLVIQLKPDNQLQPDVISY